MSEMLESALAWARRGFRVFPLGVGGKRPAGEGWREYATTNEDVLTKWWAEKPYNIGVLCNDMIVVDVDVKNGKPGMLSYAELDLPTDTLRVRTPTGGFHYYLSGPSTRNRAGIAPGVDVRSQNGYVIAPGSVTELGAYRVENEAPLLPAPEAFISLCGAPRERLVTDLGVDLDTDAAVTLAADWLEQAAPLALEGDSGDHTTYAVACKLRDFGVSESRALDLLLDHWNDRCSPPWEPDELTVKVENAYTYALGPAGALSPEAEFGGVSIDAPEFKPRAKGKWIWQGDAVSFDQQWLFYRKLPRVGTALMVAPSGAGKTFLTAALAGALGSGEEFFGTKPDEVCGALLLAAEGVSGITARLSVLGENLPIAAMAVSALHDAQQVAALTADIDDAVGMLRTRFGVRLGLIGIDTLAASGLLIDENDNSQCAAAVKNLEQLANRYRCLVMVTHHPPKNSSGARGGSALHAGFDTVLEVFHDGRPVRFVECTKGRDAPTGKWGSFTLLQQVLGTDSKMREVTTCTVSMGNEQEAPGGERPKYTDKFMEAFDFARAEKETGKGDAVPRNALRKSFGELVSFKGGHSSATKAFDKCLKWAAANGEIYSIINGDEELLVEGRAPISAPIST